MDKGTAGENETETTGSGDCIEGKRIKREEYFQTMTSVLEHKEQFWPDFDLGMLGGVKIDYENGVFRRYHVENNPVRARMIKKAEHYKWSSAGSHVLGEIDNLLSRDCHLLKMIKDWAAYLREKEDKTEVEDIRQDTRTGRPCGDEAFGKKIEEAVGRRLMALPHGRPDKNGRCPYYFAKTGAVPIISNGRCPYYFYYFGPYYFAFPIISPCIREMCYNDHNFPAPQQSRF